MQYHVVTHDLVKNFLSDFYMWCLVLDDDTWVHVMVVYDAVASFRCAVEVNLYLVGDKSYRVSFVLGQKMYKMLYKKCLVTLFIIVQNWKEPKCHSTLNG